MDYSSGRDDDTSDIIECKIENTAVDIHGSIGDDVDAVTDLNTTSNGTLTSECIENGDKVATQLPQRLDDVDIDEWDSTIQLDSDLSDSFNATFNQSLDISTAGESSGKVIQIKIGPQHFDLLNLIGEGAFGKVLLCRNKFNKQLYAMKVISKKMLRKKNSIQYMKSERDILTKTNHPFVVSLSYAFQSETKLFLVMDFLAGGELFHHLRRRGLIREFEARVYFAEMILAIEFLHSLGVIHRDLKPENVLLRSNGHICLTDFGLAIEIGDGVTTRTLCGTSEYMAPEMLTRNGYGKAVDWWSLGALFYEVLAGHPPFTAKVQKDLDRKILSERLSLPSFLSAEAHSLLKGMLERDINKRLGAAKSTMFSIGGVAALKQHTFFKGLDFHDVLYGNVAPPIDLGFSNINIHDALPSSPLSVTAGSPDGKANASFVISHFHEDFTGQCISPSVLEDCYSNLVTTANTPFIRSRANSADIQQNNNHNNKNNADADGNGASRLNDEFQGFDYSSNPVECSEELYHQFETELNAKLVKVQKKRILRLKKEEDRLEKIAIERTQRETAKAAEKAQREAAKEKLKQDAIEQEIKKKKDADDAEKAAKLKGLITKKETLLLTREVVMGEIDKHQKKIKSTKKKLRDIAELESKVTSGELKKPSADQKEKLSRKQELEGQVVECESQLVLLNPMIENYDVDLSFLETEINSLT